METFGDSARPNRSRGYSFRSALWSLVIGAIGCLFACPGLS